MTLRPSVAASLFFASIWCAWAADGRISGRLTDTQDKPVAGAKLRLTATSDAKTIEATSDADGRFTFPSVSQGDYEISAAAPGFAETNKTLHLGDGETLIVDLQFAHLASRTDTVNVTADVKEIDVQSPDPAEKVFASEDLLDANPGRPGAPISIPGYPIETASSGIKAPQYFAPGVAGDHGEPIAQYIQVGSYLVPNNLSANAHGNGYTDPNIYIANAIESVQVDGGAFNVREGNHALNLATDLCAAPASRSVLHADRRPAGHYGHRRGSVLPSIRGSRWKCRTAMDSWTGWSTASRSSSIASHTAIRFLLLFVFYWLSSCCTSPGLTSAGSRRRAIGQARMIGQYRYRSNAGSTWAS